MTCVHSPVHTTQMIPHCISVTVHRKLSLLTALLLVVDLVATEVLRGAVDPSWLGHSRPSALCGSLWSRAVRFEADLDTAPLCNSITKAVKTGWTVFGRKKNKHARTGRAQTVAGPKENKRPRSTAGEVKSPLSIQLDRRTQRSLYVPISFWEDGDYDLVKYSSKDVSSCPVACH